MTMNAIRSTRTADSRHLHHAPPQPRRHLSAVPPLADVSDHIPEPGDRFLVGLAAQAFEVIEGRRNMAQLGSAVTVGVTRQLLAQRTALSERRSIYRDRRNNLIGAGRVRICRLSATVIEAALVLHAERRSHAVAIRLEWVHARWRACELTIL